MRTVALLSALLLALAAPSASACLAARDGGAAVAPLLDLQFPEKQKCKAPDHSDCALAPGESFEMDGKLTWSWDVDNCEAANLAISADDIVITFPKFPRNPSWLELTVEPSEIRITFQDQWDLLDDAIDPATQKIRVQENYSVHVSIKRVGEPTDEELAKVDSKNGVVEVYAKAVSSETAGFQPGFAFENFRFDASSVLSAPSGTNGSNDAPAPSFGLVALGLAGLAVALRRR